MCSLKCVFGNGTIRFAYVSAGIMKIALRSGDFVIGTEVPGGSDSRKLYASNANGGLSSGSFH